MWGLRCGRIIVLLMERDDFDGGVWVIIMMVL